MNQLHKNIFVSLFFVQSSAVMASLGVVNALIYIIAIVLSLYYAYTHLEQKESSETLKNTILGFGLILFFPQLFMESMFSALISLLAWLLVAMNTSLKTRRDLYFSILGTFVLILYATATQKQTSILLYLSVYTLSSILLLVHNYFNTLLERSQIKHLSEAKTATLYLGVIITVIASFIYLLVPRPEPMQIGFLPAGGGTYYTDKFWKKQAANKKGEAPEQIIPEHEPLQKKMPNPAANTRMEDTHPLEPPMSQKSFQNSLVFYMQGPQPQYLRGKVYDYFDGKQWIQSDTTLEKLLLKDQEISFTKIPKNSKKYTITVETTPNRAKLIYAPANISRLYFPGNVIARDKMGTLYAPHELKQKSFYSVDVEPLWIANHPKLHLSPLLDKTAYLQLPKNFSKKIQALAHKIANKGTDFEKSMAIEKYLRNNFNYSLETVFAPKGEDALENFLFHSHYGHCEYFASSMVLMLRSVNIPARLVNGYNATTYNPVTGFYEIYRLDAHAWVEAYIEKEGWVSFEPTSTYALPQKKDTIKNTSQELDAYINTLKKMEQYQQYRGVLEELYTYGLAVTEAINNMIFTIGEFMLTGAKFIVSFLIHVGIYLLIFALVAFYLWHRYSAFFYQSIAAREISSCQNEQYRIIHQSLQKLFAHYGSELKRGETPLEYAKRLSLEYPEFQSVIHAFYAAVDQKSYYKYMQDIDAEKMKSLALKLCQIKKEPPSFIERIKRILRGFKF